MTGFISFLPWTMIRAFTVIHAPRFIPMHALWLTAVCIALAALLVANPIAGLMGP